VIGSAVFRMSATLNRPDQWRCRKHTIERSDIGAMRQQDAHSVDGTGHRCAMERSDFFFVSGIRIESARQHGFEYGRIAAFSGPMQHQVMLMAQFSAETGMGSQHRICGCAVAAGTCSDETLEL
jgi:hypothetical protein